MKRLFSTLPALLSMNAMAFAAEDETGSAEAPAAAAEKPAKAERVERETANGVTKPAEGSKTRRVWDIASAVSAEKQRPALRDEVMTIALAEGLNRGTVATQYGKWCVFYQVTSDARKSVRAENREAAEAAKPAESPAESPAEPEAAVAGVETADDDEE